MASRSTEQISLKNVNHPGRSKLVYAVRHEAMRRATLMVLPAISPGLTMAEVHSRVIIAHLPEDLFSNGAKSGWWAKAVQLDLDAKRIITRENTRPLRLHRH